MMTMEELLKAASNGALSAEDIDAMVKRFNEANAKFEQEAIDKSADSEWMARLYDI
jgi:hypothetical protein